MNIGDRIKQRRVELGLSADDLSRMIGKSRATIFRYENGDIENMPTKVLEPLAIALKTTPAELMGWKKQTNSRIWDDSSKKLESEFNALYYQLKSLGWTYEWIDEEERYLLTNGTTSVKITADEYSQLISEQEDFCRRQLQKLILKSSCLLNAAHEAPAGATPENKQHDEDIMNDANEWE